MTTIRIVSTISYTGTPFETAFKRGLHNPAAIFSVSHKNDTDQKLANAMSDSDDPSYDLVVTLGGLKCAIAARRTLTNVNFISLVGGRVPDFPGTITGRFLGGINLRTFDQNYDRVFHLTGDDNGGAPKTFDITKICLLINPNSPCHSQETGEWAGADIIPAGNLGAITGAVAQFRDNPNLAAMIISADPMFQENKPTLIDAANDAADTRNKYVCYPLQDYAHTGSPGHQPRKKFHTLHGPDLAKAHERLGRKAARVLADGASNFEPAPSEVHDPQ